MGEMRNHTIFWLENLKERGPLGRPRRRWEDIRMNLRKIGWADVDWMHLAQDRPSGGSCEHGNEPSGSINFREFLN